MTRNLLVDNFRRTRNLRATGSLDDGWESSDELKPHRPAHPCRTPPRRTSRAAQNSDPDHFACVSGACTIVDGSPAKTIVSPASWGPTLQSLAAMAPPAGIVSSGSGKTIARPGRSRHLRLRLQFLISCIYVSTNALDPDQGACTSFGVAPTPVTIVSFTPIRQIHHPPGDPGLTWTTQGSDHSCSIDQGVGIGLPGNGSVTVAPKVTTTYTLTCTVPLIPLEVHHRHRGWSRTGSSARRAEEDRRRVRSSKRSEKYSALTGTFYWCACLARRSSMNSCCRLFS